jgi:hypothetical protein
MRNPKLGKKWWKLTNDFKAKKFKTKGSKQGLNVFREKTVTATL